MWIQNYRLDNCKNFFKYSRQRLDHHIGPDLVPIRLAQEACRFRRKTRNCPTLTYLVPVNLQHGQLTKRRFRLYLGPLVHGDATIDEADAAIDEAESRQFGTAFQVEVGQSNWRNLLSEIGIIIVEKCEYLLFLFHCTLVNIAWETSTAFCQG